MPGTDERSADERTARRAWIAAHHPDRDGDPRLFADGLRALDGAGDDVRPRPVVVRSRRPDRVLRRVARRVTKARRTRTHHIIS